MQNLFQIYDHIFMDELALDDLYIYELHMLCHQQFYFSIADVRVDIHTYPIFHDGIKYAVVARAEELKKYHAWVLKTINLH